MENRLLKIVGEKINANDYVKLCSFIYSLRVIFTDELRISIQNEAKKVGSEISGGQFQDWLNKYVSANLKLN